MKQLRKVLDALSLEKILLLDKCSFVAISLTHFCPSIFYTNSILLRVTGDYPNMNWTKDSKNSQTIYHR